MHGIIAIMLFVSVLQSFAQDHNPGEVKLLIVTVATEQNDGYKRFMHTAKYFKHDVLVLGMNEKWLGGDLVNSVGGGQKVLFLQEGLRKYKDSEDLVIMFTDSYDVILLGDTENILNKFFELNARMVFSAENTLWPDKSLQSKYPVVQRGKRFLCSGGIIGYAKEFWKTINQWKVSNTDDDQLYYTHVYLNATLRTELNATLDHTSHIFHNLNFAKDEIDLEVQDKMMVIKNTKYDTIPPVIHGNGPSKFHLNYLANYAPDGWHPDHGCQNCEDDQIIFEFEDEDSTPHVMMGIFVIEGTPFLSKFFERIANISYAKSRISLFIHITDKVEERTVSQFLMKYRSSYNNVHTISYHDNIDDWTVRNSAVDHCLLIKCDYYFSIDSNVQLTNANTLKYLMRKNKQIIAPLVKRPGKLWSNFWGALNLDGFYARSDDYMDIVNNERIGVWNVPFINSVYLVKGTTLKNLAEKVPQPYTYGNFDSDMAFCANARDKILFLYLSNEANFGRLLYIDEEKTKTRRINADLWEIEINKPDWEEKYLHPDFWKALEPDTKVQEQCTDVYTFPLMTDAFADQLVGLAENANMWSNGKNEDPRIAGGYENVPTVDVHTNQLGFEKEWLHLMKHYITKIVDKVFPGYYSKALSTMMFIVRYRPDEQSFLRPHHDSSTWTMNVALNSQGIDYEGGGSNFIRQNCSAKNLPKGWAIIHPGRLTHYHEGLPTTKGTRYIFVSFMDP
ncbi:procollagen-lysine,2-oxoglutarate 5-dioxygenase 1-like [Styela clava]